MTKKTLKLLSYILGTMLLLPSCKEEKPNTANILFPSISVDDTKDIANTKCDLSDIFTDCRIIPLETSEKSLIGGLQLKVVKSGAQYYIKSENDVVIFDKEGRFVNRLSHVGGGPGEYDSLFDFEVVPQHNEIWVSSSKGIYRYDAATMNFNSLIPLSFFANAFKYIDEETILAMTPDENTYKVFSMAGEVTRSYYDKDVANSVNHPVDFLKIDNLIVNQLGESNDVVCFDPATKEFSIRQLNDPSGNLETAEINREYMDKHGYFDFPAKVAADYIGISSFRKVGDTVLEVLRYPSQEWALAVSQGDKTKIFPYYPADKSVITNNVTPPTDPRLINTLIVGESSDSFLFLIYSDSDTDESNPQILEVLKLSQDTPSK